MAHHSKAEVTIIYKVIVKGMFVILMTLGFFSFVPLIFPVFLFCFRLDNTYTLKVNLFGNVLKK